MNLWKQPPGGFTREQRRQRRRRWIQAQLAIVAVAVVGVASIVSYRWVTAVNPVGRSHAIDLFRAERHELAVGVRPIAPKAAGKQEQRSREAGEAESSDPAAETQPAVERRAVGSRPVEQPDRPGPSHQARGRRNVDQGAAAPEEGVYSWKTEGYEEVGGARREFPAETQRVISLGEGRTWNQHHYFSEERQIWTAFQPASTGVEVTKQRNEVTFGPVTRRSEIEFSPPMLVAPRSLRVGFEWQGQWAGDTYGTYSSNVFEHTTMSIGGEVVEVWGMTYVINLRGEQEGRVTAQVWFAPRPGLTVKEHYVQDVQSSGARYHAEWTQTLKSLQPRQ